MLLDDMQVESIDKERRHIASARYQDEKLCLEALLPLLDLPQFFWEEAAEQAKLLIEYVREKESQKLSWFDAFLLKYKLSSKEGIALMCLVEAMLRGS